MAIKERLLKQLNIVWDGLNAMPPFHSRDLNAMRNALVQARDLCFQGLSEKRFADYQDTYDGILLAINQLAMDAPDQGEIVSLCSELLQYTLAQTQKETHFKKEIFFLPYKASMWDSLESVWKAANEDKEHCIAYVMPIPYADLTPEHTVAAWHCEKDIFPKDVPTVDWQTVDLEEMHPDVIFIHNPYDEYNRVTSVESRYYSRNLKKCTDKLVYIPYFVLAEPCSEDGVSQFALTSGVQNADIVVLQSEAMRQVYVSVLSRDSKITDRKFWEKRILGIGSPKIDKVLASKREDFEMPERWRKLVKGKKVILYNTSLGAMLQNSDKVCKKLRYVFDFFRNRNDVAFWWRPHPLMKSTLHSMCPRYEEEYLSIEKQYIEEGWGIYDDSPDLHRAICWSDAYYGDVSSVANLYVKTNKPLLYQTMDSFNEICEIVLFDVSWQGNGLWFVSRDMNIIGYLSYKTMQVEKAISIDAWKLTQDGEYGKIALVNDVIVAMPYSSRLGIYVYRVPTDTGRFVQIRDHDIANNEGQFSGMYVVDGKVYGVPYAYPSIIEYDACNDTVKYHDAFAIELEHFLPKSKAYRYYAVDSYCMGDSIFIPFRHSNLLIEFDTVRKIFTYHKVGHYKNVYEHITFDGINFWISSARAGESLVRWNPKTHETKEYFNFPSECDFSVARYNGYSGFVKMICLDDTIYMFPGMLNLVIEVDVRTGNMKKNTWITQCLIRQNITNWYTWFQFVKVINTVIYAGMYSGKKLLVIDTAQKNVEVISVGINQSQYEKCCIRNKRSSKEGMMMPDITYLIRNTEIFKSYHEKNMKCGEEIYSLLNSN